MEPEPVDPRLLASGPLHVLVVDSRTACRKATVGLLEQVSYKVGELYECGSPWNFTASLWLCVQASICSICRPHCSSEANPF